MKFFNLFFTIIIIYHWNLINVSGLLLIGEISFPIGTKYKITKDCFKSIDYIANNCRYNLMRNVIYCNTTINDNTFDLKISIKNRPKADVSRLTIESVKLYKEKKHYRKSNEIKTTNLLASTLCRNINDGDIIQYSPYKQWFQIIFSDGENFKAYYDQIFVNLSITKPHDFV